MIDAYDNASVGMTECESEGVAAGVGKKGKNKQGGLGKQDASGHWE